MQCVRHIAELRDKLRAHRRADHHIGLVPTMGYLHDGHLSLVRAAHEKCDITVVSIFVNPAQFGPNMDLDRYPRDLERDLALLEKEGVDYVFAPSVEEIYPKDFRTWVEVEHLTNLLDGASRPGYFRGICTVVTKLFTIVRPHSAFFGQKDYQQAVVIQQLAKDLNLEVDVAMLPTIREADGLAMSSRNALLSPGARAIAPLLYRALQAAAQRYESGERSAAKLITAVQEILRSDSKIEVDYIEVVDARELQRVELATNKVCLALAVQLEGTRLIDNILLG